MALDPIESLRLPIQPTPELDHESPSKWAYADYAGLLKNWYCGRN